MEKEEIYKSLREQELHGIQLDKTIAKKDRQIARLQQKLGGKLKFEDAATNTRVILYANKFVDGRRPKKKDNSVQACKEFTTAYGQTEITGEVTYPLTSDDEPFNEIDYQQSLPPDDFDLEDKQGSHE